MRRLVWIAVLILGVILGVSFSDDVTGMTLSTGEYFDTALWQETGDLSGLVATGQTATLDRRWRVSLEGEIWIAPSHNRFVVECEDGWFEAESPSAGEILSVSVFDPFFAQRKPAGIRLFLDGAGVALTPVEMEWQALLPNGSWRTYEAVSESVTTLRLTPDDEIGWSSGMAPDEIWITSESGERMELPSDVLSLPSNEAMTDYRLEAVWNRPEIQGRVQYALAVSVDQPLTLDASPLAVTPGQLLTVHLANTAQDMEIVCENPFTGEVTLWREDNQVTLMIPVDYWTRPGDYRLSITSERSAVPLEVPITITPRDFGIQYLYIDETIAASTRNDEAYEEYALYMDPARATSADEAYFDGPFIQPVEGRLSTEFGMYRYVNDSLTSYRHSGLDLATAEGTPIMAAQNGVVTLAQPLILTGNTVVIDHGLGLFSVYFHMHTLNVAAGESVKTGEVIGTVGSTGFSTGPHLHWTLSHYKTNLDPVQLMDQPILP